MTYPYPPPLTEVATGRSEVPYDNLASLGVQVYGLPLGIPFHSPILYNQQQLQQILANLEKIVFLKGGHQVSLHFDCTELLIQLACQKLEYLVLCDTTPVYMLYNNVL